MALRERAALGVLAGEADRDAVDEQRGEGERLGLAPVDPALGERGTAPLELAVELRVDREAVRHAKELLVQRAEPLCRNRGRDAPAPAAGHVLVTSSRRDALGERRLQSLVRLAQAR